MNLLNAPKTIARSVIGDVFISTVVIPRLDGTEYAETMIFLDGDPVEGLVDQDFQRGTVGGAQAQHNRWVRKVSDAVANS